MAYHSKVKTEIYLFFYINDRHKGLPEAYPEGVPTKSSINAIGPFYDIVIPLGKYREIVLNTVSRAFHSLSEIAKHREELVRDREGKKVRKSGIDNPEHP